MRDDHIDFAAESPVSEEVPFVIPPRESWWRRKISSSRLREFGFGGLGFTCFLSVWLSGVEDMSIAAPALTLGFVLSAIGIANIPGISRLAASAWSALVLIFAVGEGLFLFWHFHLGEFRSDFAFLFSRDFKSSIPRHAFVHKPAEPKPAPPPVVTVPPTPKPPPPWVTQTEIEDQRKIGHPLTNYSPDELLGLWRQGRNLAAYFGKWIKVDYQFNPPLLEDMIDKKKYYIVQMSVPNGSVRAYFDAKKWESKLILLRPKDQVKAFCYFDRIDRTQPNPYLFDDKMIGYDCELL